MADENNLMTAALAQIGMEKLDYKALGDAIDVSPKAARERWRRLCAKLTSGKPATGASEDTLMNAALRQIGIEKLDYKILADAIKVTPKAARERWRRLHAKLSSGSDKTISGGAKGESKSTDTKKAFTNKRKRAAADEQPANREEETPSDLDMPKPKTPTSVRKGSGGKKQVTKKAKVEADNNENKAVKVENGVDTGNGSDWDDVV